MFVSDMTTVTCLNRQAKQFHKTSAKKRVGDVLRRLRHRGNVIRCCGCDAHSEAVGAFAGLTSSKATSHRAGDLARPYHFSYRVLARWAQFSDSTHQAEKKQA